MPHAQASGSPQTERFYRSPPRSRPSEPRPPASSRGRCARRGGRAAEAAARPLSKMAAPRRGVAPGGMKRGAAARARRGGKLDRLRQAVQDYVQAAGGQPPLALLKDSEVYNRRSRRDARKEKRKVKRSRRRRLQRGELVEAPTAPAKPAPAKPGQAKSAPAKPALAKPGQAKPAPAKPGQAKPAPAARPGAPASPAAGKQRPRPVSAPTAAALEAHSAAAATSARKRALLEANEEEEKEIRRLERQLGLGKRRKKKQEGAAAERLPQSFLRDGLGYVLGALGTRAGLSQLCDSSDEEQPDTQPGPRERPLPKEESEDEEDGEDEEDDEDEEAQEDASDPSEVDDEEGHEENESSSPEDGGVPEASDPSSEEEEEEVEVGCSPQHARTCFPKRIPQPEHRAESHLVCLLCSWAAWSVVLVQNSRASDSVEWGVCQVLGTLVRREGRVPESGCWQAMPSSTRHVGAVCEICK